MQGEEPYKSIYKKLLKVIPNLIEHINADASSGKSKLNSGAMMDLNFEYLGKNEKGNYIIALSHYYQQNGKLIADPYMEIQIIPEIEAAEAMTYRDSFGYQQVYVQIKGKEHVNFERKRELNIFLNTWLRNLIQQGHLVDLSLEKITNEESDDVLQKDPALVFKDAYKIISEFIPQFEKHLINKTQIGVFRATEVNTLRTFSFHLIQEEEPGIYHIVLSEYLNDHQHLHYDVKIFLSDKQAKVRYEFLSSLYHLKYRWRNDNNSDEEVAEIMTTWLKEAIDKGYLINLDQNLRLAAYDTVKSKLAFQPVVMCWFIQEDYPLWKKFIMLFEVRTLYKNVFKQTELKTLEDLFYKYVELNADARNKYLLLTDQYAEHIRKLSKSKSIVKPEAELRPSSLNQADPLASNGVYTKESAGDKFVEIEIQFPKAAKFEATIDIVQTTSGEFKFGIHISRKFGDHSNFGFLPHVQSESYPSRKEAIRASLLSIIEHLDANPNQWKIGKALEWKGLILDTIKEFASHAGIDIEYNKIDSDRPTLKEVKAPEPFEVIDSLLEPLQKALWTNDDNEYPKYKANINGVTYHRHRLMELLLRKLAELQWERQLMIAEKVRERFGEAQSLESLQEILINKAHVKNKRDIKYMSMSEYIEGIVTLHDFKVDGFSPVKEYLIHLLYYDSDSSLQKDSNPIFNEVKDQNTTDHQSDPVANDHGVDTNESARENFETINIDFPKATELIAGIILIKTAQGDHNFPPQFIILG